MKNNNANLNNDSSLEKNGFWNKFNKIKVQKGVNLVDFSMYMKSLRTAYDKAVKDYMVKFNNLTLATNLAYSDFFQDIKALENGEILFDSKVPGFRRF